MNSVSLCLDFEFVFNFAINLSCLISKILKEYELYGQKCHFNNLSLAHSFNFFDSQKCILRSAVHT